MKRATNFILGLVSFSIIAFVAYLFFLAAYIDPPIERFLGRRALSRATEADLQSVVAPLGAVFHFPDGSWLAIRYRDSHALSPWSFAIAHDSGGQWFESSEHFCAALRVADSFARIPDAEPPADPPRHSADWVRLLAASPDLSAARHRMERYFRPLP